MRPVLYLTFALLALSACGTDAVDSPGTSTRDSASTTVETSDPDAPDVSATHPCETMVVEPDAFESDINPDLEELGREDFDARWLSVDDAVGCRVSLTAPGQESTAVGIEGYVFDPSVVPVQELIDGLVGRFPGIASTEVADGVLGLVREDSDVTYAVAMESSGIGVYVQTSFSDPEVDPLISVARSILDG